jgi:sulfoxide reductase catalytic subunit YedY
MIFNFRKANALTENDVTDESVYKERRAILKTLGYVGAGSLLATARSANAGPFDWFNSDEASKFVTSPLDFTKAKATSDILTPEEKATTYNNFYEFGTGKGDPVEKAQDFKVNPWTLKVEGLVEKPLTLRRFVFYVFFRRKDIST